MWYICLLLVLLKEAGNPTFNWQGLFVYPVLFHMRHVNPQSWLILTERQASDCDCTHVEIAFCKAAASAAATL